MNHIMLLFLRSTADTRVTWEQEIATMSLLIPCTIAKLKREKNSASTDWFYSQLQPFEIFIAIKYFYYVILEDRQGLDAIQEEDLGESSVTLQSQNNQIWFL